jgi:hypothetical protein
MACYLEAERVVASSPGAQGDGEGEEKWEHKESKWGS